MKIKRFLAGMAAGVLAAAAMAVSVSAASTKLGDVLDPNAEVAEGEENPFYKVGGMTFFMNGSFDSWNDNSGTWFGIDEEGRKEIGTKGIGDGQGMNQSSTCRMSRKPVISKILRISSLTWMALIVPSISSICWA